LQTKEALLVYKFISNGTPFHHICLRVAAETALALDYLRSLANPPIVHGDVKTVNILPDEHFTVKIADFTRRS
jgi:serine/threonine protein kinase